MGLRGPKKDLNSKREKLRQRKAYYASIGGYKKDKSVHIKKCNYCFNEYKLTIGFKKAEARVYCSVACRDKSFIEIKKRERLKQISLNKKNLNIKKCEACRNSFITAYNKKDKKYCSQKCARKNSKKVYKMRIRAVELNLPNENINPLQIFNLNNWICQICKIKTPPELRGRQKDNSPELDHIIPLSKGGSHCHSNVQTLCRKCNIKKSDKIIYTNLSNKEVQIGT